MKAPFAVLCAGLALTWVTAAGAQSYGQSGSQTSNQDHMSKKSSEVKLIGCLAQGSSTGEYVLNNVQPESGKHGKNKSNAGQTGTSGTSGMSGEQGETNMSFDLVPGSSRVDLSKYVGQKVEIRGRVEPEQGGSSGMSGETGTSGQSGSMGGSMSGQSGSQGGSMSGQSGSMSGQSSTGPVTHKVSVSSVKQLGTSCQ